MRVPVVFVFRVLLAACLCVQPVVPAAASDTKSLFDGVTVCDTVGYTWIEENDSIVVDRSWFAASDLHEATYRIDDVNGYWLFPATPATIIEFTIPGGIAGPISVSIAQMTTDQWTVRACAPAIHLPYEQRPASLVPVPVSSSVVHLTPSLHVADPVICEHPFVLSRSAHPIAIERPASVGSRYVPGFLDVLVDLDSQGNALSTHLDRPQFPDLDDAVLSAAMRAQFEPAIFRCRPIASRLFIVVPIGMQRL